MGLDCPGYRCRWVRDRLPLFAGGELTGADRRSVERHLIACPACLGYERSLAGSLGALRTVAALAPVGPEAPSLWPALARQIRESRHETRSWFDDLARLLHPIPRLRPVLVMASVLVLAGLTTLGVEAWARWRITALSSQMAEAALPIDFGVDFEAYDADLIVGPPAVVSPVLVRPLTGPQFAQTDPPAASSDRTTAARFDYDLDHGTPMGPDSLDVKASY